MRLARSQKHLVCQLVLLALLRASQLYATWMIDAENMPIGLPMAFTMTNWAKIGLRTAWSSTFYVTATVVLELY